MATSLHEGSTNQLDLLIRAGKASPGRACMHAIEGRGVAGLRAAPASMHGHPRPCVQDTGWDGMELRTLCLQGAMEATL